MAGKPHKFFFFLRELYVERRVSPPDAAAFAAALHSATFM